MTTELRYLALAALLGFVQIVAAAAATVMQHPGGLGWAAGSRDEAGPPPTGVAARLTRARTNFFETFPIFAAAVLVAHLGERNGALTAWGAAIYVLARVLYVPLYVVTIPFARSLAWGVSVVGMLMVLTAALVG